MIKTSCGSPIKANPQKRKIQLYLTDAEYEELDIIAKSQRRTKPFIIRELIIDYLASKETALDIT